MDDYTTANSLRESLYESLDVRTNFVLDGD
jgi:hypothetical protein